MRLDWPDNERLIRFAAVFVVRFSVDESCLSPQWDHICVWWQSVQWRRRWLIGQCLRESINWETLFRPAECWLPELGHSHRFCGFSCRFFTSCNVERFGLLWLSSLQGQWSQKLESQQGRVLAHSCPDGRWFSRVSELVASFYLIEKKEGDGRQQQFGKAHGRSSAIKAGFLSTPQMELWRTVDTFRTRRRIHQYPAALFCWHYNCCYQKLRQGRFYCHVTHGRIYSCLCYVNTKNFCC